MNPTDLPDLSKPKFVKSNRGKTKIYRPKFSEKPEKHLKLVFLESHYLTWNFLISFFRDRLLTGGEKNGGEPETGPV